MPLLPIPDSKRIFQTDDDEVHVLGWHVGQVEVEADCPALGAAMRGEVLPFGAICTESHSQPDDKAGAWVWATYKKPKRLDVATDLTEIRRVGPRGLTRGRITGTRVFLAPDSTADAEIAAHLPVYSPWSGSATATVTGVYDGSTYTTLTGTGTRFTPACVGASIVIADTGTFTVATYASGASIKVAGNAACVGKTYTVSGEPVAIEVEPYPQWRTGLTRIVAHYSTLGGWHPLERNPGVGVLEMDFSTIADKRVYDLDGDPVETEFFTAGIKYRWHLVRGTGTIPRAHAVLRIRVVLSAPNIATLAALVGSVNSDACPKLGNAGVKTLWLRHAHVRQSERYSTLYWADIRMEYLAGGWHQWSQVEKQKWQVLRQSVLKADLSDSGKKRDVGGWISIPAGEGGPTFAYRDEMPYAAFAALNGYIP